ncbi:MAG: GNAT family N-acetyltransferase [Longimicrobiales bacterium]
MSSHATIARADLQVRAGTTSDTDRILELVKLSLGEGAIPRDRAYWTWKHEANPFGASPVLLAESGGELVGLRVFMRWGWQAAGTSHLAVRAVDTATHPAWQGKGIFSQLTRELVARMTADGVHFVFNTPNDQSRPGYLKMGWQAVGRTDLWIRPLRPLRIARAVAARRLGTGTPVAGPDANDRFTRVEALCMQPGLPALLASAGAQPAAGRLATQRTPEYLRWRYGAIPGFRYQALFAFEQDGAAALVFRYKHQGSLLELRLAEVMVGGGRGSVALACRLLDRLAATCDADYLSAMAARGTPEQRALVRSWFLPFPRGGPILTVRPLNATPGGVDPLQRGQWRLSIGDLELF